jgi:hypothetical protein
MFGRASLLLTSDNLQLSRVIRLRLNVMRLSSGENYFPTIESIVAKMSMASASLLRLARRALRLEGEPLSPL